MAIRDQNRGFRRIISAGPCYDRIVRRKQAGPAPASQASFPRDPGGSTVFVLVDQGAYLAMCDMTCGNVLAARCSPAPAGTPLRTVCKDPADLEVCRVRSDLRCSSTAAF